MAYPVKGETRNTGRTHFKKGNTPWNKVAYLSKTCVQCDTTFSVKPSLNRIQHCSDRCADKTRSRRIKGPKSYLWKGGRYDYLRPQVKLRDNYTCQRCGLRDPEIMQVDHIKPRAIAPELVCEMSNLVTLCPNCHARKTIEDRRIIREAKSLLPKAITAD